MYEHDVEEKAKKKKRERETEKERERFVNGCVLRSTFELNKHFPQKSFFLSTKSFIKILVILIVI